MGELKGKEIVQSHRWLDNDIAIIPDLDYVNTYPVTVYDAVHQTMDDNSPTLADELITIYRLINQKQDIIDPGIPGNLMTWTGVKGQIGTLEVTKTINPDPLLRSNQKIPTEKAIGTELDLKVPIKTFLGHTNNMQMHITDVERAKWNQMAPLSSLMAHIQNSGMHITADERNRWNQKADQTEVDEHIYNMNNPHNVTAHQVGTYTREEIDELFEGIRESFFNYLNIYWDDRDNTAKLVEYHPVNWNPNYVLQFGDTLPDVDDPSTIYFAVQPATDHTVDETQDVIIYVKRPGLAWQEVGFQTLQMGDMVIRYPDTTMYVWVQGRFMPLFSATSDAIHEDDRFWRPSVDDEGYLSWTMSKDKNPPEPVMIKGQDGYTPIKGVDYDDGKDGEGVSPGGAAGDLLVKLSDENYDTTWKSFMDILNDLVLAGLTFPKDLVEWEGIKGRPEWYNELGDHEDGFITQWAVTRQFNIVGNNIAQIQENLQILNKLKDDFYDHINDFNNPHRVTPEAIGAVSHVVYTTHVQNFNNPHQVTPEQIGLGNVDNTADMDKPVSTATQEALDELLRMITEIIDNVGGMNFITNCIWDGSKVSLTFTFRDGNTLDVHIPLTETFKSLYFDKVENELVLILPDGSEHRVDISSLLILYKGSTSANIKVEVEDDHVIKATVVPGSIGELEIAPSVHLRMSPTTTTQPVNDRSTRIATTEFVKGITIDNLISYETDRPLSANMGRVLNEKKADIEDVIQIINDMEGIEVIDNLDSTNPLAALSANMGRYLDVTKAPRVHTSPSGSTFGRATISLFGHSRASDVDPLMDGTVFRGTDDGYYARGDHRHPTDITRAPMHWPDVEHDQYELTGEPKAVNPPDDSNDHRIATTEWVRRNAVGVSFGKCTSATNVNPKIVTLESSFVSDVVLVLQKGSTVSVTFTNDAIQANRDTALTNTANIVTNMNVQGTGAHPIKFGGKNLRSEMIKAGYTYIFTYDGENWNLENPTGTHTLPDQDNSNSLVSSEWVRRNAVGVNYGTCVTGSTNPDKVANLESTYVPAPVPFIRQKGSTVAVLFSNQDWSGTTNTTLNVNGTGAAKIIFGGRALTNGMLGQNHVHQFTFDGTNWRLINPVPGTGFGTVTLGPGPNNTPRTINRHAGQSGFTTQADGTIDENGYVNRVWFGIDYVPKANLPTIEVSTAPGAFAAEMGDGTVIGLSVPKVVDITNASCVIQFNMDTEYPSNSPCLLVYKTNQAYINVTEV